MYVRREMRLTLATAITVLVTMVAGAYATGWEVLADLPEAQKNVAVAAWHGNVYIFGGSGGGAYSTVVWKYDPDADDYTEMAAMPTARGGADAVTYQDKIYVLGGSDESASPKVEIYDPDADSWANGANIPNPPWGTRAVVHHGVIYLIGGHNTDRVQAYDIATNTWLSDRASLPSPRGQPGAAVYGDKIYVFAGGYHGGHTNTWEYDVFTNTWDTKTNMPYVMNCAVAGVIGSHIYVYGDREKGEDSVTLKYDPHTDSWERVEDNNYLGRDFGGTVIAGKFYKFGGSAAHPDSSSGEIWAEVYVALCDYYVSANTGSDTTGNGTSANPWKTITYALTQASGSAAYRVTIHVAAGTYDTSLGETFPLNMEDYVRIRGTSAKTVTVDADGTNRVILFDHVDGAAVNRLTITGGSRGEASSPWQLGGGILCYGSSPSISKCKITYNHAIRGGGIGCWDNACPTIDDCVIAHNTPTYSGGGIQCWESSPTISDCVIAYNSTQDDAGGISATCNSSPTIENCLIIGNSANTGGGICCSSTGTAPSFINCTVAHNSASQGGGIYCAVDDPSPSMTNCILWGDSGGEVCLKDSSTITITYSDVQGGYSGAGNINSDPEFRTLGGSVVDYDDYFLDQDGSDKSLCIDVGNMSVNPYGGGSNSRYITDIGGYLDMTTADDVDMGFHYRYWGITAIELVSFDARAEGSNICLTWQTGAEIDNAGFVLFRMIAGAQDYEQMSDLIAARGGPASGASYSFTDMNVEPGVSYNYWLVDIETTGKWTAHGPVSARSPMGLELIEFAVRRISDLRSPTANQ